MMMVLSLLIITLLNVVLSQFINGSNTTIIRSSCDGVEQNGLFYIMPLPDYPALPVICSHGFAMLDQSLDLHSESYPYFITSSIPTTGSRDISLYRKWFIPADERTQFKVAINCIECVDFDLLEIYNISSNVNDECICYKTSEETGPIQYEIAISELPLVTVDPDEFRELFNFVIADNIQFDLQRKARRMFNLKQQTFDHNDRAQLVQWHNDARRKAAKGLQVWKRGKAIPSTTKKRRKQYEYLKLPAAANMNKLRYSLTLEQSVKRWFSESDQNKVCQYTHDYDMNSRKNRLNALALKNDINYQNGGDYGENLGYDTQKVAAMNEFQSIIRGWEDERKNFKEQESFRCKRNAACGHYTVMMYATVQYVGCAWYNCQGIHDKSRHHHIETGKYVFGCHYYPYPEGPQDLPYVQGEPCGACNAGYKDCQDGLCAPGGGHGGHIQKKTKLKVKAQVHVHRKHKASHHHHQRAMVHKKQSHIKPTFGQKVPHIGRRPLPELKQSVSTNKAPLHPINSDQGKFIPPPGRFVGNKFIPDKGRYVGGKWVPQ